MNKADILIDTTAQLDLAKRELDSLDRDCHDLEKLEALLKYVLERMDEIRREFIRDKINLANKIEGISNNIETLYVTETHIVDADDEDE